jgi:hypothetical protein
MQIRRLGAAHASLLVAAFFSDSSSALRYSLTTAGVTANHALAALGGIKSR